MGCIMRGKGILKTFLEGTVEVDTKWLKPEMVDNNKRNG